MKMNITGYKRLCRKLTDLQLFAEEVVRTSLDEKREKFEMRPDTFRESPKGQTIDDYLGAVEQFLDDLQNIEWPESEE